MELRPLLVLGALLALVLGNAFLISREEITKSEQQTTDLLKRMDPLRDIVYAASDREKNFALFGLDADAVSRAVKRAADTDADYGSKLKQLLIEASDPIALADALCGSTDLVRPRYGALAFLVEAKGSRRQVLDMRQTSTLDRQGWAAASSIPAVFETVELSDSPQPDATIMAMAAILEKQEDKVIQRERPWGRPAAGQWDWDRVQRDHDGIQERVIKYLALMHVTVELAQSSDGICGE